MLITAALALTLTPLLPLRVGVSTAPSRVAALSCKLSRTGGNKQQDLADLMARAKAVREGVAPPEPLKPSAKSSKPTPLKPKAPKASAAPKPAATRDQMFAMMQNAKMQKMEQTASAQLSRFGQEKPRPERVVPQQAKRPDPSAMGGASKQAPPTAEEYAKFGQLLGSGADARGPVRAVSDEVLTRGAALPLPARGLAELDGVPSGFGSLEALAAGHGVLVLLASVDTLLGERWRSTLSAFHGQADFAALGAQVAAVSRVPTNAYRKLSRKAGVAYPLLSDPQSMWLGPLRCETGSILAFVVDPREAAIVASFRGSEPLELLRRVTAKLEEYRDGGAEAGATEEGAVEEEAEAEGVSDAAALDEMAAMWAEAEGDTLSAAEAAWGLDAEEESAEAGAAALQAENEELRRALDAAKRAQQAQTPPPSPSAAATAAAAQAAAERGRRDEAAARAQAQRDASAAQAQARKAVAERAAAERAADLTAREAAARAEREFANQAAAAAAQAQQRSLREATTAAAAETAARAEASKTADSVAMQLAALQAQLDDAQAGQREEAEGRRAAEAASAAQLAALRAAEQAATAAAEAAQMAAAAARAESEARRSIEQQVAEGAAAAAAAAAAEVAATEAAATERAARLAILGATFVPDESKQDLWRDALQGGAAAQGPRRADAAARGPRGGAAAAPRRDARPGAARPPPSKEDNAYKFVYLPGLYQVARLLNGTDGISAVVSSRIRKGNVDRRKRDEAGEGPEAAPAHLVELIADAAEAATPPPQPAAGVLARRSLRIALNGKSRKAHQLTARGGAGWEDKTQLLFVTPEGGFDRSQLVEKLRALELVLGFELTVDPEREARSGSEGGEQEGGA